MANAEQLAIIKQGVEVWNEWRASNSPLEVDLIQADLTKTNLSGVNLAGSQLMGANFKDANLTLSNFTGADIRDANFEGANLTQSILHRADIKGINFRRANLTSANLQEVDGYRGFFEEVNLEGANLADARFPETEFTGANLKGADFARANLIRTILAGTDCTGAIFKESSLMGALITDGIFKRAILTSANLQYASITETDLGEAILNGCKIFGLSAWALEGVPKEQSGLVITTDSEPEITVDDLQVAQFIHLLLNNKNVRNVIDTITSKAVLILGRFMEERKAVLDALHTELRKRNYLPILFDFNGPESRDITETVSTLAHMARFVIADLTDAKSIPQELQAIVPNLPSVPVQPILLASQTEYGMFEHFKRYPWVLPTYYYQNVREVISSLPERVLNPLEAKVKELTGRG